MSLTERRRYVLASVVQEHVKNAQPVGSKTIKDKYNLDVSPATIRNDLAALEKMGYLTHPHTSAGRVPTEEGYRYFVRHLMEEDEVPEGERRFIRTQLSITSLELDQWMRLTTSMLAYAAQGAALVTAPRAPEGRFKHIQLISIDVRKVLMVLVLQSGTVKQRFLDMQEDVNQDELTKVSNELNALLTGKAMDSIAQTYELLTPFAQHVSMVIGELMRQADARTSRNIYRDGLARMLEAPEFVQNESMRSLVQVLEERTLLQKVVDEFGLQGGVSREDGVRVVIAGDGRFAQLQDISLVIGRYGTLDRPSGFLGVVGPLRMSYARSIGAVRFVSALMNNMVEEVYG